MRESMQSEFNPFVWAYMLTQDEIKYGRSATEMAIFYSKLHSWTEEFEAEVIAEIQKLKK